MPSGRLQWPRGHQCVRKGRRARPSADTPAKGESPEAGTTLYIGTAAEDAPLLPDGTPADWRSVTRGLRGARRHLLVPAGWKDPSAQPLGSPGPPAEGLSAVEQSPRSPQPRAELPRWKEAKGSPKHPPGRSGWDSSRTHRAQRREGARRQPSLRLTLGTWSPPAGLVSPWLRLRSSHDWGTRVLTWVPESPLGLGGCTVRRSFPPNP